jgi:hypothetical protein
VGRRAGVKIQLSCLWSSSRGVGRVQRGEQRLVVPGIHRGRRLDDGRRWILPGEVRLVRWRVGARTKNAGPWNAPRHGPGLNHASPWVQARSPGCGGANGVGAGGMTAWRSTTAATASATATVVGASVGAGGRGRWLGRVLVTARAGSRTASLGEGAGGRELPKLDLEPPEATRA